MHAVVFGIVLGKDLSYILLASVVSELLFLSFMVTASVVFGLAR